MHRLLLAIDALEGEFDIATALRRAEDLAWAAAEAPPSAVAPLLGSISDGDDLTAIAAVHALSRLPDDRADAALGSILDDDRPALVEHAAWALSARIPARHLQARLVHLVRAGGFTGMLAQRTLIGWAASDAEGVGACLERLLAIESDPAARARLVETLGEVPGDRITAAMVAIASDGEETLDVRASAVSSLGHRPGGETTTTTLARLSADSGPVSSMALLALDDLADDEVVYPERRTGLRLGQLFVHAELDPDLDVEAGGDRGGIAILLASLGPALARHRDVESVLTIGRGSLDDTVMSLMEPAHAGHSYGAVAVGPVEGPPPQLADAWPCRVRLEHHVRRILRRRRRLDVLHLRMADVGTLAAARVARQLAVPIAFSVAPDPHGLIDQAQQERLLDRGRFGEVDQRDHLWFRARMVERLVDGADRLAFFPRPTLRRDLRRLIGIDLDAEAGRAAMVPEGIDLDAVLAAERDTAPGLDPMAVAVRMALDDLPAERHGLPVLITVGRLHPAKGVARVVDAWASDRVLRSTHNLVVVGGQLDRSSSIEQHVLDEIRRVVERTESSAGLVLLGHRSHAETLALLAHAARGLVPQMAAGGVYVDGAPKEEFGLALVEALATGLPVVGPAVGAPATYVDDGVTGVLAGPSSPLAAAIRRAVTLVDVPGRPAIARQRVADGYTVDAMADALVDLYRRAPVPAR